MGIMYKLMKHRNLTMDLTTKTTSKTKSDKCRLLTIDGHIIETSSAKNNDNDPLQHKNGERDVEKRFTAEHILQLCKFLAEKSKRNKNLHIQQQSPKKLSKTQKHFQFQSMDYDEYDNNDNDEGDGDNFDDNNVHLYDEHDQHNEYTDDMHQNEAKPLLSTFRSHHQKSSDVLQMTSTVLSSRLSPDINALNISSSCLTATMPPTTTNQQHHGDNQHHQRSLWQHQQHLHHHSQHDQHTQQQQTHQQGKRDILLKIRHQIFERKRLREKGYEPQALQVSSQVWRPW